MTYFKMIFPILMAVLLTVNVAVAADDTDDPNGLLSTTTGGPDIWYDKECTISDAKNVHNQVYMTSFWTGRIVSYKWFDSPEKKGKWFIHPVKTEGKTYFEFKNVDRETYIAPFTWDGRVSGNFIQFGESDRTNTLWTIDPPRQGVPVYIQHYDGQYMNEPKRSRKQSVYLSDDKKTKWIINCK